MRRNLLKYLGVAGGMVLASLVTAPAPILGQGLTAEALDDAMAARRSYGLPAGRSHVESLLDSARAFDAEATAKYGFPLTRDEYSDLVARNTYVRQFQAETLPYVRQLDGYAGVWIDQEDAGRIVVALTDVDEATKAAVRDRLPEEHRGIRFEEVNDSDAELNRALTHAEDDWASLGNSIEPQAFGIQHRYNRLIVKVLTKDIAAAREDKARAETKAGVDVAFEATTRIRDTSCPSRHKCFGPLRLGARINQPNVYDSGNPNGQWNCAIGFMLSNQTILTAGHCVHGTHDGPWHGHDNYKNAPGNYGRIGEKHSSRYTSHNRDLALITLEDWPENKTKRIFGDTWPTNLTQEDDVIDNMDVCVSLSRQDLYICGKVREPSAKWKSEGANIWVWGAGMNFNAPNENKTSLGGDSGGPVVYETGCPLCQDPLRTPIGIINAGNEADGTSVDSGNGSNIDNDLYFAKVQWALNNQDGWPSLNIYNGAEGTG